MCDIFKNELLMLLNDKVDDSTLINISCIVNELNGCGVASYRCPTFII